MRLGKSLAITATVAAFATLGSIGAQRRTEPGMLPYTPTRIEWLALQLNANYREDSLGTPVQYSVG